MPNYEAPTNDTARAAFLKNALAAAESDRAKGNNYVLDSSFAKLATFAVPFEAKVTAISASLSDRVKEFEEGNKAMRDLEVYVRDAFESLRRLVLRSNLSANVLSLYGLPLDGITPKPTSSGEWLTIARTFIEGAAKAVALEYPAVGGPSAEEISVVLEKAQKEFNDMVQADRNYDEVQAELAGLRREADELIGDVMAELRLTLRKFDISSQRRIMRTYGARFKYLQGEPVDGDDAEPILATVAGE